VTFAQVTLRAAKYTSGIVLASVELLQDTAVDLVGYILGVGRSDAEKGIRFLGRRECQVQGGLGSADQVIDLFEEQLFGREESDEVETFGNRLHPPRLEEVI